MSLILTLKLNKFVFFNLFERYLIMKKINLLAVLVAGVFVAACNGGSSSGGSSTPPPPPTSVAQVSQKSPIGYKSFFGNN